MNKLLKSKVAALIVFAVVVVCIIFTFKSRTDWWMFGDVFFAFMMTFCHLMALTLGRINRIAARNLEYAACICGVLFVIAFIIEFFVIQSVF